MVTNTMFFVFFFSFLSYTLANMSSIATSNIDLYSFDLNDKSLNLLQSAIDSHCNNDSFIDKGLYKKKGND